jgi:signal transduction histidine kinase
MPRWRHPAATVIRHLTAGLSPLRGAADPPAAAASALPVWGPRAAAAAVGLGCGAWAAAAATQGPVNQPLGSALLLGGMLVLPLAVLPIRPAPALWISLLATALVSEVLRAGGDGPVWAPAALLVHLAVLGGVALASRPPVAGAAWVLTAVTGAILVQRMPGMNADADLGEPLVACAVVILGGMALRGRWEDRRRLATSASVARDERARRTVLEERARIARELHDVVAHHMSVVAIQAEAAPYRVPAPSPEVARSLTLIRSHAVEALTELQRVLGVLRDGAAVDTGPQPGVERLGELVATAGHVGLDARLTVHGPTETLPPGVGLSAYRIVQEALSNVMRHAPGAAVEVTVDAGIDRLELQIVNGPTPRSPTTGPGARHGLLGMRERVGLLGGQLTTAPAPDGGFTVRAELPLQPAAVDGEPAR